MKTLKHWVLHHQAADRVELRVDNAHHVVVYVLAPGVMRVLIRQHGQLHVNRTWSITPQPEQDVPWQGRERDSSAGFPLPGYQLDWQGETLLITSGAMRVNVHQPLWLEWEYCDAQGEWQPLACDRPTGAYLLNMHGDGIAHYQRRSSEERCYGLGEKAGDLNRAGRRFEFRNLDAMGYNAQTTDPLYKHLPFTIIQQPGASYGVFYDNLSVTWLDLGNEIDNYHPAYRRYQAHAGDLDYYMLFGPAVLDVTKAFVRLTGKTCFGPKWSLGYSGSTMHYTDAPDAQQQLLGFISLCKQHGIACDSFQLSSGYTSIGNKRYVFNWNYDKVPQPEQMTRAFHDAGLHLAANIKPCLLQDHPRYQEVAAQGLFVRDSESDNPERSSFWDDEGSHLDFTNPDTVAWWQQNVTGQLLEKGIDSTWNDNNEFEIWDGEARCHGFGQPMAIKHIRPLMPLLMMRASMEAQQRFAPQLRPYLISRSGSAGMQRYVQTWSGDNRTSWQTLRYNTRMGVGMSLSGLYNIGHDVGGFAGDKPEAELFVRWVQNGVMHPRFTIHSWNDDATVNEPWMYPAFTPIIRDAIQLRYRLLPYFYTLLWRAHAEDEPLLRPTFLDHEHDPKTFEENDDFMLGRDVLVASVVTQGAREREVYLPDNTEGWYDFYQGEWFSAGQTITLAAPLERLPLLVRAGAMLPLSSRLDFVSPEQDDQRTLQLFPLKGNGRSHGMVFDDDGVSHRWRDGQGLWLYWDIDYSAQRIDITFRVEGAFRPAWQALRVQLPDSEHRALYIHGECTAHYRLPEPVRA
ncbi:MULTISPECIES: glycoside hydrolase family 31 protein [Dickeya]|uniref:Alpha-glucosidase n=1 Tax=Dickeya aquatica TaxID=1401087 RepID=A0A375ADJ4_9GAMM|nr:MULTISPECIES: glycoside hydrolase family 31 protein [Dickeya]SLM63669.1 Alpha-glucosidase [Dickeya aquatica]